MIRSIDSSFFSPPVFLSHSIDFSPLFCQFKRNPPSSWGFPNIFIHLYLFFDFFLRGMHLASCRIRSSSIFSVSVIIMNAILLLSLVLSLWWRISSYSPPFVTCLKQCCSLYIIHYLHRSSKILKVFWEEFW